MINLLPGDLAYATFGHLPHDLPVVLANQPAWVWILLGALGGCLAWTAYVTASWLRLRRDGKIAQHYLQTLAGLDFDKLLADGIEAYAPAVPQRNNWHAAVSAITGTLQAHCQRLRILEHARTACEVRANRAATEMERLRAVFAGLPDPVLALDEYNELILANPSAEETLQFRAAGAPDRALARLVRCEKLVQLLTATTGRTTPGGRSDEVEIADAAGQQHWYRVTAKKLDRQAETGSRSVSGGTIAVLRDIGDQKNLQKRNAEFVSSVSHEMKTPLAGIKAYVELLVDGDADDEATREEFLNVINTQADRLQRLIDNLLNLARIEAGVVHVDKQPRSLNELLEESLRVVQPAAESKQIELIKNLSPMYLGVLADRDLMLQAAINLLSNAIKYTHPGGKVTLHSRMVDNLVRFEVADTGVGLSPEDAQKVFEKFYRVKKDQSMASGTGLGLPLAKHIVEDVHGGELTVESVLGQGSTFAATMPCAGQIK